MKSRKSSRRRRRPLQFVPSARTPTHVVPTTMTSAEQESVTERSAAGLVQWIDPETSRRGQQLFDQQFWLWGQDVATVPGNGLLQFGFERHPPPRGRTCSSCYTWTSREERLAVWGFGLYYGRPEHGGVFLQRYTFAPCLTAVDHLPAPCWGPEELPEFSAPSCTTSWMRAVRLLEHICDWVVRYETWGTRHFAADHREQALIRWKKRCSTPASLIADWQELQQSVQAARFHLSGDAAAA